MTEPARAVPPNKKWFRHTVEQAIKDLVAKLGRVPTRDEAGWGLCHGARATHGGWTKAVAATGNRPRKLGARPKKVQKPRPHEMPPKLKAEYDAYLERCEARRKREEARAKAWRERHPGFTGSQHRHFNVARKNWWEQPAMFKTSKHAEAVNREARGKAA